MPVLEEIIQRLGISFTVRDIMVPKSQLVCASNVAEANRIAGENRDYDIIPILDDHSGLTDYYDRDARLSRPIGVRDLVGGETSLMDLVDILAARQFCFVLVGNEICGYVHFSDLNNPLVKLSFYVIFEAVERHLLQAISPVTEEELQPTVSRKRLSGIKREMRKAQANRANPRLGLESFLYMREILKLAVDKTELKLDESARKDINSVRNRVSHAGWLLVEKHEDVNTLIQAKCSCISVLGGTARLSTAI